MNAVLQKISSSIYGMRHPLLFIVILGLAIRFVLAPTLTFNIDMGYWTQIINVFENGFGLYGTNGYYYTPIWGYILGADSALMDLLGIVNRGTFVEDFVPLINEQFKINAFVTSLGFNFMVKLPLILVDLAIGVLLYQLAMRFTKDRVKALLAFMLWMLCPLAITQSAVHGMFDNVSVLLILLSMIMAYDRHYFFAGLSFSAAVFTKFFPLFFIFFLVAIVIKHEGTGKQGINSLSKAIGGSLIGAVLIYLPNIIKGDFWMSLYFLGYRVGITRETLGSIGVAGSIGIAVAILALIALVLLLVNKVLPKLIYPADKKSMDRKVRKVLLICAAVFMLAYAVFAFTRPSGSATDLGMTVVAIISIFSVFLEIYLAYRLLIADSFDDKKFVLFAFLSGLAVILWVCAPSYILIAFPFIILYAAVVDRKYVRPFIVTAVLFTFMEITAFMLSPTSLIVHLGGDVSVIKGIMEFLSASPLGFINNAGLITGIFGAAAFISLLYISFKWYWAYYKGGRSAA